MLKTPKNALNTSKTTSKTAMRKTLKETGKKFHSVEKRTQQTSRKKVLFSRESESKPDKPKTKFEQTLKH